MEDSGKDKLPSKHVLNSLVEQAERSTTDEEVPKMVNPKRQEELDSTLADFDPKKKAIKKAQIINNS